MHTHKSASLTALIFIIISLFLITSASKAKSLYVGMHNDKKIRAYKISSDHLQYQMDSQGASSGWTGMTLDPDSGIVFATAESNHNIYLLNAKSMIFEGMPIEVKGATSTDGLSEIVFDQNRQKLYIVDRQTQHLFSFFWNGELKILTPDGESYKTLSGLGGQGAWGIDIDKQRNEIYVTNAENVVHFYDTTTWQHKGSIPITIDHNEAVGIAIDSQRHYMYTGYFTGDAGDMRDGFYAGTYNSRGVHFVDPTGKPEKELAAKYRKQTEEVENSGYYRLANTLRSLAVSFRHEEERIIEEHRDLVKTDKK